MKASSTFRLALTIGTALGALLFAGAVHAWAAVTADPAVAPPTGQVTVTGSHFSSNSLVEVFLKWKRCSVTTDAQGQFTCTFKVPKVLEPGPKKIWTVNRANGRWVSTPFTVRTDWGNEAFDAGRTRYNPYENVINRSNVSQLQKLWTESGTLQIVAGGNVFVKRAEFSGLLALKETNGKESWRLSAEQFGGDPRGIASANGRLYAGRYRSGELYVDALRTQDGSRLWTTTWQTYCSESSGLWLTVSRDAPLALYILSGACDGGFSDQTGSLRATDGHAIWTSYFSTAEQTAAHPLSANGLAYQSVWSYDPSATYRTNIVLKADDGTVVLRQKSTLFSDGPFIGRCSADPPTAPCPVPPVFSAGFGFVVQELGLVQGARSGLLVAEGGTLAPRWSWTAPEGSGLRFPPAITPNTVYAGVVGPVESRLYAFKTRDGTVVWNKVVTGNASIQPTVANGVIYLGNKAYDTRNGKLLWTNPELLDTVSPIVVNGRLYANQTDGKVSAWGLK